MTVIEKDYRCKNDRDDVLDVTVYTEDNEAVLSINGGNYVMLTEKKIRKLIKQLKKALPKEASPKAQGFKRDELMANLCVGDRVRVEGTVGPDVEGIVLEIDEDDRDLPLRIQPDAIYATCRTWIWVEDRTRVFKLN